MTIRLGGGAGTLKYYLTNGTLPISEIDLAGTDPTKSTVSITVTKPKTGTGNGRVGIGEVDGSGFKSFTAKTGDLTGAGFNLTGPTGYAGSITVGNVGDAGELQPAGHRPGEDAEGSRQDSGRGDRRRDGHHRRRPLEEPVGDEHRGHRDYGAEHRHADRRHDRGCRDQRRSRRQDFREGELRGRRRLQPAAGLAAGVTARRH